MTLIVIVLLVTIGTFVIAFISPRHGRRIQTFATHHARRAYNTMRTWPGILRKSFTNSIKIVHTITRKSASKGRKDRDKAPF